MSGLPGATTTLPLAGWKRGGRPFVLIGHRGAAGLAPENTMPSFELAHALGSDAIELDVHLSRDGVPVVIHDDTVDRTTNGAGRVGDLSAEDLAALDASRFSGGVDVGIPIPTLGAVLSWARGKTRVMIELKGTTNADLVGRTIAIIRQYQMAGDVVLMSFAPAAIEQARSLAPDISAGILYANQQNDPIALAKTLGAKLICPHWTLASVSLVREAHLAGLGVSVWTANDASAIQAALSAEVDAITTDFPDRVGAIA